MNTNQKGFGNCVIQKPEASKPFYRKDREGRKGKGDKTSPQITLMGADQEG